MSMAILDRLWMSGSFTLVRFVALSAMGVLLLTISAKLQVPFYPVPVTMQTFAILVICVAGGLHLGGSTILAYLAVGAMGLPVFAGGSGIAYMFGPTGGFLLGFWVAAVILGIGVKIGYDRRTLPCFALMISAVAVIFICGYLWLSSVIGFSKAWQFGVAPFILGDLLKAILAVLTIRIIRQKVTE